MPTCFDEFLQEFDTFVVRDIAHGQKQSALSQAVDNVDITSMLDKVFCYVELCVLQGNQKG